MTIQSPDSRSFLRELLKRISDSIYYLVLQLSLTKQRVSLMDSFNNFPEEIMLEILTRLPTESVLDCKLVCKPWRGVVRHRLFSQMHLKHLNSADEGSGKLNYIFHTVLPEIGFYYSEYDENSDDMPFSRETKINLSPAFEDYRILGSCNGLICFCQFFHKYCVDVDPAYVCNPITREYVMLPKFEGEYLLIGFGYSPSTNEYKIVSIYKRGKNVGIVRVYTLGSVNGWRNAGTVDVGSKYFPQCAGLYANGAIHWMDNTGSVGCFHLADEKCTEVPSPALARPGYRHLRVLGGFVSVLHYYYGGGCDVWLLKENKDNGDLHWSNEFSFDSRILRPFGYTKNGKLLCYKSHKICSYGPQASSPEIDVNFGKSISEAIPHKNTLVSLKLLGERNTNIMEVGERSLFKLVKSKETENNENRKKPPNKERDL